MLVYMISAQKNSTPIFSWLRARKTAMCFFGILIVAFAFFSAMKHEPIFMDGDPFYHAKITQLILEHKNIVQDFPWLPQSVLAPHYYDHHFLFHIFLLPFVAVIGDPLIAMRIATSFFSALFLAIFYLFFRKLLPSISLFPLIIILVSSSLLFRLSLDKAPAISLIFLFGGLYALIRRKYFALFILSFLYVWLYDAWPLMLIAVILFCIANALSKLFMSERVFSFRRLPLTYFFSLCIQKENILLLASCLGGLLSGIIINPYFPYNVIFYKTHLLSIAVVTSGVLFGIGNEWLPINPFTFANENLLFMVFWMCALCWTCIQMTSRVQSTFLPAYAKTPSSLSPSSLFFMIFSLFLFLATIKSQRMGEYFIPIGSAFIACTFQDFFKRVLWREWIQSVRVFLKNQSLGLQHIFCCIIGIFFIVLFFSMTLSSYVSLWNTINTRHYPFHSMAHVSAFISHTLPKGSLIINEDWSYFPQLMYYADEYRFAWGLDPTFTHDANPQFFSALVSLGKEKEHEKISDTLKNTLHASYLLIEKNEYGQEKKLTALAKKDKGLKKIYEDEEALLYETVLTH